ncbi:MAG TPA: DUF4157 domain-containing protein [Gaiellaceae bacterium]|nr:DUF4157 domain-containing protein [Gaiellaceae bacterium]
MNPVWTEFALQAPPAATSAAQHPPSTADVAVSRAIALSGARLDQSSRDFFGPRFGADFSDVRIHTGSAAADAAQALHARAFTVGSHIVFGRDAYAPNTRRGRRLIAHELTHVVQQGASTPDGPLRAGSIGDRFERQADAAARAVLRGDRATVAASTGAPSIQMEDLAISDFDPNDISPMTAVSDPQYVDNGLMDAKLRSNGSVFNPVFTGLTLFYKDGSVLDVPAAGNSAFPAFSKPTVPVMTVYRRHLPSGKIFPITVTMADFLAAPGATAKDLEDNALAAHAQFLLYKTLCPAIDVLYTNAVAAVAFAYSGLIAQIWNVAMGVRGAVQIFTMTGAFRAMAAGRAALGLGGTAARQAATQSASQALATIGRSVLKTGTLTAAEQATVSGVESRLVSIVQRAIANVNAGTATGAWAQRLAGLAQTDPMYKLTLGNAIHEEAFELARQEVRAGTLPAGLQSNVGRAIPGAGLPNSYGGLRPDWRLPLSGGNEAVFDITTTGQAGHAQPYTTNSWVKYVVELLY